jgi:hypothetical protein
MMPRKRPRAWHIPLQRNAGEDRGNGRELLDIGEEVQVAGDGVQRLPGSEPRADFGSTSLSVTRAFSDPPVNTILVLPAAPGIRTSMLEAAQCPRDCLTPRQTISFGAPGPRGSFSMRSGTRVAWSTQVVTEPYVDACPSAGSLRRT